MFKTTEMLYKELHTYKNPANKVAELLNDGKLILLKEGLYTTDKNCPVEYVASIL